MICKQLENKEFRFIRLGRWNEYRFKKTNKKAYFQPQDRAELKALIETGWRPMGKTPIDKDWQNTQNYAYNNPLIANHNGNIGILTGIGNLAILDDDSNDKRLIRLFKENFGDTFQIRKGGHLYFIIDGLDHKIIFQDPQEKNKEGDKLHLGELQSFGQQCVTFPSIHPIGEIYSPFNDCEIIKINFEEFEKAFFRYIPKFDEVQEEKRKNLIEQNKEFNNKSIISPLNDLKVTDVISTSGFYKVRGGLLGAHPGHGATNGGNFLVNNGGNTWTCYRHNNNDHHGCGNAWTLIAVLEGIIDCSDAGPGCLSTSQFNQVLKIAKEKYGIEINKKENWVKWINNNWSGRKKEGWAIGIDIRRMAEKNDLLSCPDCNTPFEFDSRIGFYKCNKCKVFGGLKKFSALCLKKIKKQNG